MSLARNRKVTEFFARNPKPSPRTGQPIYNVSSSDVSVVACEPLPASQKTPSRQTSIASSSVRADTRVIPSSPDKGEAWDTAIYVSSSPDLPPSVGLHNSGASPLSLPKPQLDKTASVPKPPSRQKHPASPPPKNQVKKRKQAPIHIISSDDSDRPVLQVIRVSRRPFRAPSKPHSQSHGNHSTVASSLTPLSQRQNILDPFKCHSNKPDANLSATASPPKKSKKRHRASSMKSARHPALLTSENPRTLAPDDADDEEENEDPPILQCRSTTPKNHHDGQICAGTPLASLSHPVPEPVPAERLKEHDDAIESDKGEATPQETLDPSLENEMEYNMEHNSMAMDVVPITKHPTFVSSPELHLENLVARVNLVAEADVDKKSEDLKVDNSASVFPSPPSLMERPPSVLPSKLDARDIIARIKAKAEAEADAELQLQPKQSDELVDEDVVSVLSSLSSLSDEDDEELLFELSPLGNASGSGGSPVIHPPSNDVLPDIRRSTRNQNNPPPNYAKKLELFRDDAFRDETSSSFQRADNGCKVKDQSDTPSYSPLDMLLKVHENEDARRVKFEKMRKTHLSGLAGLYPETKDLGSGVRETPEPSWPADIPVKVDRPVNDSLMGDAEREELLGKEGADAVGKILAGDRAEGQGKQERDISFWDIVSTGRNDILPELIVNEGDSLVLHTLCGKLNRKEYQAASLFINLGFLASVCHSARLLEWLFLTAMSTFNLALSTAAYRALMGFQRENSAAGFQLRFETILASLSKFGVNPRIISLLGARAEDSINVSEAGFDAKCLAVRRFAIMLEALGRSGAVDSDALSNTILCLLVLALDSSADPELQQDVIRAIEGVLCSPMVTPAAELEVCKRIVHGASSLAFTPQQEARLLCFLSGCGRSSGRVRRWTAWAMLGGDLSAVQACEDIPPFEVLANLFGNGSNGHIRLEVDRDTDYEALGARVEVLSVALTDVESYVRSERAAQRADGGSIDGICKALEIMNGKIVDTRAAYLDRTRTKDAINMLQKRLVYQRHGILDRLRGNAGKIDGFVIKKSLGNSSKPKPTPITSSSR